MRLLGAKAGCFQPRVPAASELVEGGQLLQPPPHHYRFLSHFCVEAQSLASRDLVRLG